MCSARGVNSQQMSTDGTRGGRGGGGGFFLLSMMSAHAE